MKPSIVAAIGAFDGLHLGHQRLMLSAQKMACDIGAEWGIVTFAKEKSAIFDNKCARLLFSQEEQVMLERTFDIPNVIRLDFDDDLRAMKPEDFLNMLCCEYGIEGFAVGHDFRFGCGRSGDAATLMGYAITHDCRAEVVDIVLDSGGNEISSSAIRRLVAHGDMEHASLILGYPFFLTGLVCHGDARGRKIGFPTANVAIPARKIAPADGVYAAFASVDGELHSAAVNVGTNPTFNDVRELRIEVNLIDRSLDLYGKKITVFFISKIRDESIFFSIEELSAQIGRDVAVIRAKTAVTDDSVVRSMRAIGRQTT